MRAASFRSRPAAQEQAAAPPTFALAENETASNTQASTLVDNVSNAPTMIDPTVIAAATFTQVPDSLQPELPKHNVFNVCS